MPKIGAPGSSGIRKVAKKAPPPPPLDLQEDLVDSDLEEQQRDVANLLNSPASSNGRSRARSRSPLRSPSPPIDDDTVISQEFGTNVLGGGNSPPAPSNTDVQMPNDNDFSDAGGEAAAAETLTPRANFRATARARGRARKNPPSQGELYEKYMAAKILAEEKRAENYQTGADANRAALQAAEDQSRAARDTSRAMLAMASFYENEQRRSGRTSSPDTNVTLPVTPITPYHHPPLFFPFENRRSDTNFGDNNQDSAAAAGDDDLGPGEDENENGENNLHSPPSPTY